MPKSKWHKRGKRKKRGTRQVKWEQSGWAQRAQENSKADLSVIYLFLSTAFVASVSLVSWYLAQTGG